MRSASLTPAGLTVLLAVLVGAVACDAASEPVAIGHFALTDLASGARLERLADAVAPDLGGARIEGVEGGVGVLSLTLRTAGARDLPASPGRRLVFQLPVPALEFLPTGVRAVPVLTGTGLPPGISKPGGRGEWEASLAGARLFVAFPEGAAFPSEFELRYRVRAARLFGHVDGGAPVEALASGVQADQNSKNETLFVPAGARLTVPLPTLEAGTFHAQFKIPRGDTPIGVVARFAGVTVFERELSERAPEGSVAIDIPSPPAALGAPTFEVEVRGATGGLLSVVAPHFARERRAGDPPNLVVLLIDTLRADRLGALGGERNLSPALDKLADESLVFTESWSTCSWTLPSVATIFTSNHAEQHRARTKAQRVSADVDTLAGVLRDAGYRTAAFTDGGMVHHSFGLERGFMLWNTMGGPLPVILSRARQFLETAGDGPYFLFVHSYEVHSPYDPPEEARAAVVARHGDLLGGRAADPLQVEDLITRRDGTWRVPPDLAAMLEALYDEEVRFTDREVGEWLDELRGSGVLDRALFVVTSDHGEEFGEHGLLGHSDTLYREQLHVPLLLRFPAGSPLAAHNGRRDGDPISHLDLAPTLVDALGLGDRLLGTTFDGVSVFASSRRSPIWATRFHDATGLLTALRDRRHVWIDGTYRAPRGAPGPELYDLASDPRELENLRQAAPEEAARLAEIRRALLERYGARHKVDTRAEVDAELEQRLQHLGY